MYVSLLGKFNVSCWRPERKRENISVPGEEMRPISVPGLMRIPVNSMTWTRTVLIDHPLYAMRNVCWCLGLRQLHCQIPYLGTPWPSRRHGVRRYLLLCMTILNPECCSCWLPALQWNKECVEQREYPVCSTCPSIQYPYNFWSK